MIKVIRWIIEDGGMDFWARVSGGTTDNVLALGSITFALAPVSC
jgi:hypothetical protein